MELPYFGSFQGCTHLYEEGFERCMTHTHTHRRHPFTTTQSSHHLHHRPRQPWVISSYLRDSNYSPMAVCPKDHVGWLLGLLGVQVSFRLPTGVEARLKGLPGNLS